MAFAPDGKILATGSWDGTVGLWDAITGERRTTLGTGSGEVRSVAFAPDGRTLAAAAMARGEPPKIKLWNVGTGELRISLTGHTVVAFSPDGRLLATPRDNETVTLWDVATGQALTTLQTGLGRVRVLAFSQDGEALVTANGYTVAVWDIATGQLRSRFQTGAIQQARFLLQQPALTADGETLATARPEEGIVELWGVSSGRVQGTMKVHVRGPEAMAFSPDGQALATAVGDIVAIWSTAMIPRTWPPVEGGRARAPMPSSP